MEVNTIKNINVGVMGLAFMLMFTAFQTMGNIQTTILNSATDPHSPGYVEGFHGSGFISLAVIYAVFSLANWLAPPIVAVVGPRFTMVIGALFYVAFIAQFVYLNTILLYAASAGIGFGAAILWTAQGNFLTLNSDSTTMSRNSGIFWAMLMSSNLIGNTFVYFEFKGLTDIDTKTRVTVSVVLAIICACGTAVLLILRPATWNENSSRRVDTPKEAFLRSLKLFTNMDMLLLSVTFFYTGLVLTFWSGVYGPCLGSVMQFGNEAKSLVGLHGIAVGAGEIIGGALFGIFGSVMVRRGRDPVVVLGFIVHMVTFFVVFLNIPNNAPFGDTDQSAVIKSNPYIAVACSFLLGFGDACYNTQIFSMLGVIFSEDSVSAFAIFKFMQSLAAATAFFYSTVMPLYYQLFVLVLLGFCGSVSFLRVELTTGRRENQNGAQDSDGNQPERRPTGNEITVQINDEEEPLVY